MAYSPVKQIDADPMSIPDHDPNLGAASSPHLASLPVTPLSSSFHEITDSSPADDSGSHFENVETQISRFLSSLTSSSHQSYDLVEKDDYEAAEVETPTIERHLKTTTLDMAEPNTSPSVRNEVPIRTASVSHKLAMNHPMPDLQSLQGAYVKNVEWLEESAERLSMDYNLEEEIQRVKHEQRQVQRHASQTRSESSSIKSNSRRHASTHSMTGSVIDVNSGSQPVGNRFNGSVASPASSVKSPRSNRAVANRKVSQASKLSFELPEPRFGETIPDPDVTVSQTGLSMELDPRPCRPSSPSNTSHKERPTTSGSIDTYQQSQDLFNDFDGVHYAADRNVGGPRRISITRPPRARDSRAFREPQPGEEMIYYPAPVPVMLNLPMRLSRMNWDEQEKRRLKALSNIPNDMRKSAAWLANEEGIPIRDKRNTAHLPPQLRASAFFDHRAQAQNVQLKGGSAVATLDSILDAAAHAPVSAFTDHPIAGNLGNDFYGSEPTQRKSTQLPRAKKAKRKSSISNLLKSRRSSGNLSEVMTRGSRIPSAMLSKRDDDQNEEDGMEDEAEKSIAPDPDEMPDQDQGKQEDEDEAVGSDAESDNSESQFQPGFSAAPTTLLAELQMRKAQQRQRNRTAADAFPNGMHSTLLELDTVTQLQQRSRRQKHVKLAWEDKDLVDKENYEDDEVPLGVLFPEKEQQNHVNLHRPLGLMEKKELEENEPLSHRRARLRGEAVPPPSVSPAPSQHAEESSKPMLDLPSLAIPEDDDKEEETLAQRKMRIKNRRELGTSADFARDLGSELGLSVGDNKLDAPSSDVGSRTFEVEETLGQRRKRLQAEALKNGGQETNAEKQRKSLADVLRANPIGYIDPNHNKTAQLAMREQERAKQRETKYLADQEAERYQAYAARNKFGYGNQSGLIQDPYNGYPAYQQPVMMPTSYIPSGSGMNALPASYAYGYNHSGSTGQHFQPINGNPAVSTNNIQMTYPYQYPMGPGQGHQLAMQFNGNGPPLDQKQRARIEGWRQGIM